MGECMSIDLIIHSANQVLTLAGDVPKRGAAQGDLAIVRDGAVAISGETIVAVGDTLDLLALADTSTRTLTPCSRATGRANSRRVCRARRTSTSNAPAAAS